MTGHLDPIDKSGWPDGPWMTEPDRWLGHSGQFKIMAIRNPFLGSWLAYAGVPRDHKHYGVHYSDMYDTLGYHITHSAKLEWTETDLWWFGIDFGSGSDYMPGMEAWAMSRPDGFRHPEWVQGNKQFYAGLEHVQEDIERVAWRLNG